METINDRFALLRKACNKTQKDFAEVLGLSQPAINGMENGKREILDRHLLMLQNWKEYHVNIDWLKTGEGEMFLMDEGDALEALRIAYDLTDLQFDIVATFVRMAPADREIMLDFMRGVMDRQRAREAETEEARIEREAAEEAEEYRKQLIREKTAAVSSVSSDAGEKMA